jgi:nitrite reductase/ring-hydroxylating ferredoxin subunit
MEAHLQDGRREGVTRRLCAEADISEGEGRGFVFGAGTEREAIFVIRWNGALRAYRNSCPHAGTPIDWPENRFFDISGKFLMCGTHGAVFRPDDGVCIEGPCQGRALARREIRVEDGVILWINDR